MLQKLHEAFCKHNIPYYWNKKVNLLSNIGNEEMKNMERRLFGILKNIEKQIITDQYAIAKYVCKYIFIFQIKRISMCR